MENFIKEQDTNSIQTRDTNSIQTPSIVLSKKQREIQQLLSEGLTQKEITQRLNLHKSTVSLIVKILRKKGIQTQDTNSGGCTHTNQQSLQDNKNIWRFHSLELEINPYFIYDKYYKQLKERGGQSIKKGLWRYSLYYKKVILWLQADEDFKDEDKMTSIMKANLAIDNIIDEISREAGFEINKEGRRGIKLLKMHLARTNAPEWEAITEKNMFISFRGKDGKPWLQYDRSKGFKEREYVHSVRAIDDSDIMEPYFDDLRENKPLKNSEIETTIRQMLQVQTQGAELMKETAAATLNIMKIITPAKVKEEQLQPLSRADYIG